MGTPAEEYDIAVSFAGEHRQYVEAVVTAAKALGLRVFYDRDMTNELWGKNFLTAFRKVYSSQTRYFVPFISAEYFAKPFPRDEFSYAMLRAVERGDDYVLPILVDDTEVPPEMLHPHIGFLRAADHTPAQLAEKLRVKVDRARVDGRAALGLGTLVQAALRIDPTFPGDLPDFTNRVAEIEEAERYVSTVRPVIVLHGIGGVGKSKLAIHLAHRLGAESPGRLLYLNMRGRGREPIDPLDAVDVVLSRLNIVPLGNPQLKVDQWHTAAARMRAIVLLDNVETADQVEHLIPNAGSTVVLVTCRSPIALDAAKFLHVREFDDAASRALISGVVGAVDPEVVAEVAGLCAHLPIALRAVAIRLISVSAGTVLTSLRAERTRLAAMRQRGSALDVLTCLVSSYHSLSDDLRRAFIALAAALAAVPGADFGVDVAAAVLGVSAAEAALVVDDLVVASVLDRGGLGRYTVHDLYRLVAKHEVRSSGLDDLDRSATERAITWYAEQADGLEIYRSAEGVPAPSALPWLRAEAANAHAAAQVAVRLGMHATVVRLALTLTGYFRDRGLTRDAEALLRTAQEAAIAEGDGTGLVLVTLNLADLLGNRDEPAAAVEVLRRALAQDVAPIGRSGLLASWGARLREVGDHGAAISTLEESVAIARGCGDGGHTAWALNYLGLAYEMGGRPEDALRVEAEAQRIYERLGDPGGITWVIGYRSRTLESLGRYDEVERSLVDALGAIRARSRPTPGAEAWMCHRLCEFYSARGRWEELAGAAGDLLAVAEAMDNDILRVQAGDFLRRSEGH